MSRSFTLAVVLLAGVVLSPGGRARADNDRLIVPWQRIGPIELGMSAAEADSIMGEPPRITRGAAVDIHSWKNELSVYVRKDASYVTQVCALGPGYATAEGLRPGAPDASVTALLGQSKSSLVHRGWWKLSYTDLFWPGLTVSVFLTGFDANHTVRMICVNHNSPMAE